MNIFKKLAEKWFPEDIRVSLPQRGVVNPTTLMYESIGQLDADTEMTQVIWMLEAGKAKIKHITFTKQDSSGEFGSDEWGYFLTYSLSISHIITDPSSSQYNMKGTSKLTSRMNKFGNDIIPSNDDITLVTFNRMIEIVENTLNMPIEEFTEGKFFYILTHSVS